MGHLSNEDRRTYARMREQHILDDVDSCKLDISNGIILVTCSDGDQILDTLEHAQRLFHEQNIKPRIHVIALNGGGLLISDKSPLVASKREDLTILEHIAVAQKLKGINTVAIYTHAPCGAGTLAGLTLEQEIELLLSAKVRIKETIPDTNVSCFCHIDRGNGKRTYHVSRNRWILMHMYPDNPEMWQCSR
ncbi:MAG: hypothetical protein ACOYUZ_01340 [Patescibacteria group bacterium]